MTYRSVTSSLVIAWADDRSIACAMVSRARERTGKFTPYIPSQETTRDSTSTLSPTSPRKRQWAPSPYSATDGNFGIAKQRRLETDEMQTTPSTPVHPQSHAPTPKRTTQSSVAGRAARLKSIQEGLEAAQRASQAPESPGKPRPASVQASPSRSAHLRAQIEAALQEHHSQSSSDVPHSPTPSSRSQKRPTLPPVPLFERPSDSQSSVGYSLTDEIEEAEFEDMEDKAIQTDPYDDDEIEEDFWRSPPHSAIRTPVLVSSSLPVDVMDIDFGTGRLPAPEFPEPDEELGRGTSWASAPMPSTPARAVSTNTRVPGGTSGGGVQSMLLTPPGSSHTQFKPTSDRGRSLSHSVREPSPSPSPQKGKGREMARTLPSAKASQWQMIQDDPVRIQSRLAIECVRCSDAVSPFLPSFSPLFVKLCVHPCVRACVRAFVRSRLRGRRHRRTRSTSGRLRSGRTPQHRRRLRRQRPHLGMRARLPTLSPPSRSRRGLPPSRVSQNTFEGSKSGNGRRRRARRSKPSGSPSSRSSWNGASPPPPRSAVPVCGADAGPWPSCRQKREMRALEETLAALRARR